MVDLVKKLSGIKILILKMLKTIVLRIWASSVRTTIVKYD